MPRIGYQAVAKNEDSEELLNEKPQPPLSRSVWREIGSVPTVIEFQRPQGPPTLDFV